MSWWIYHKHTAFYWRLESYGLQWCFYQLFGLSFWRHPFTAENPSVSKWCNAKFLQTRSDEETTMDGIHFDFWVNYSFQENPFNLTFTDMFLKDSFSIPWPWKTSLKTCSSPWKPWPVDASMHMFNLYFKRWLNLNITYVFYDLKLFLAQDCILKSQLQDSFYVLGRLRVFDMRYWIVSI